MNSFISQILDIFKPIRKNDPVFGSMRFMGEKLNYWEGKAIFLSCNSEIEVFVDGEKDSDLSIQHEFFQQVCAEWPELSGAIWPKLEKICSQFNSTQLAAARDEFVVTSISVPNNLFDVAEWETTFRAKSDESHSYSVEMKGRVPIIASYDT